MDYLKYYGLLLEPFTNAPVNRFYYNSRQHAEAMLKLQYAVSQMKGLAVVEGDVGTGKTTLARRMLEQLPSNEFEAALLVIVHSEVTADWLLRRIALQLGVERPSGNKLNILSQLYQRLVDIYQHGKKSVVLIDEAQMLKSREVMEEFRGMLNLEVPGRKLITFVLFGLRDLSENLRLDEPLRQRVALRYRLKPLDLEGTSKYIIHRLRNSGARKMFFTKEAIAAIHHYTGGNPRLINTTCDNALLEGFLRRVPVINRKMIEYVAEELDLLTIRADRDQRDQEERKVKQHTDLWVPRPEDEVHEEAEPAQAYADVDRERNDRSRELRPPGFTDAMPARDRENSVHFFNSLDRSLAAVKRPSETNTFIPKFPPPPPPKRRQE